jgi:MSHA biogenesis protein MshQ
MRLKFLMAMFAVFLLFAICIGNTVFAVTSEANTDTVSMGSAAEFTVLSVSNDVTCTNSTIEGDVSSSNVTQNSCVLIGDVVTPVSQETLLDFNAAYSALADEPCPSANTLTTLEGQVLEPGTYCFDAALTNTNDVLTLEGNASDTWLFKIGTSGTGALVGTDFVVEMSGGAKACNVTWWVAEAVTLTRSTFKGNILAGKAVTVTGASSSIKGRVMAHETISLTNADVMGCEAETSDVIDHYRLEHDGQGFTCEAETLTIKACENADCTKLSDNPTQITLSPSGWLGSDTLSFTGSINTTISHSSAGTITFAKTSASPNADLRCFNGFTETCALAFVNDGFEFFAAQPADKQLEDQLAGAYFNDVNIRAVRDDGGVCKALLEGPQDTIFTYNCISPDACLTPFGGIGVNSSNPNGDQSGTLSLTFDSEGIASFSHLNYGDAGRLQLSVKAVVDGVTLTSGSTQIDVVPYRLVLDVAPTSMIYTGTGDTDTYTAGKDFSFYINAYGTTGTNPLANYQAGYLQLKLTRKQPDATSAIDGTLTYGNGVSLASSLIPEFTPTSSLTFVGGVYSYQANYDEVGQISIDVQDDDYLGQRIASKGELILGDFIPAYFSVALEQPPQIQDTCNDTFSYIAEELAFAPGSGAIIRVTGKNALDQSTKNYSADLWHYDPSSIDLNAELSYLDSSSYISTGTSTITAIGSPAVVSDNGNYDGSGLVTMDGFRFRYNKVDSENSAFDVVSPFAASIEMVFSADFFTQDGLCFKEGNDDATCNPFTITNIIGANMRYGRLALDSTYGPDNEPLTVNIKAEYYDDGRWQVNTDDSCTAINFTEESGQLTVTPESNVDITDYIDPVKAAGEGGGFLSFGESNANNDFFFSAPDISGQLHLSLNPNGADVSWPDYLNFDWEGDDDIDSGDAPSATVTFGQFRGNDRIIQWREVFN